MEMVTTCPQCGTSFRVTPDHLRARAGQVRCGRCATVFDGFKALAMRDAAKPQPTVAVAPAPTPEAPQEVAPTAVLTPAVDIAPVDAPQETPPAEGVEATHIAPPPSATVSEPPLPAVAPP